MIDTFIFDVDGTLLDSVDYHARAWQETFERYGVRMAFHDVRKQIGKGADQLMPVFLTEEQMQNFGEKLKDERGTYFKDKYLPLVKPFPGVRDLFSELLRADKRVALASSGTREEVETYKRIAGISDLLEAETSADDAERSKPHPDIFEAALEKLGHPEPRGVVVIGDTPYDAEAASKAGLRTFGVLCGGWSENELVQAGCAVVYRDPLHLLDALRDDTLFGPKDE